MKKISYSNLIPNFIYNFGKKIQLKQRIKKNGTFSLKIVLGSGGVYETGWIPSGIETINICKEKDWLQYFSKESIDNLLAEHVWEHMTYDNAVKAAEICYSFLKKGGRIRIAVPDGFHPDPKYIAGVDVCKNPKEIDMPDSHKVLYNYKTLSEIISNAGFSVVLLEYYDEYGEFHYNDWEEKDGLVYRTSRFKFRRKDVSILNMPNYTSLLIDGIKS